MAHTRFRLKPMLLAAGAALALGLSVAHAKPFKWANAGEIAT